MHERARTTVCQFTTDSYLLVNRPRADSVGVLPVLDVE